MIGQSCCDRILPPAASLLIYEPVSAPPLGVSRRYLALPHQSVTRSHSGSSQARSWPSWWPNRWRWPCRDPVRPLSASGYYVNTNSGYLRTTTCTYTIVHAVYNIHTTPVHNQQTLSQLGNFTIWYLQYFTTSIFSLSTPPIKRSTYVNV